MKLKKIITIAILVSLVGVGIAQAFSVDNPPPSNTIKVQDEEKENENENIAPKLESKVPYKYQKIAYKYCDKYNLAYPLVIAIIEVESGGKADSVSATNDYGLMQINECNHEWLRDKLGITDFLSPEQNIHAGCYYLRYLFKHYEDTELVVMAYNLGGNGALELWHKDIRHTDYSDKVFEVEQRLVEAQLNEI